MAKRKFHTAKVKRFLKKDPGKGERSSWLEQHIANRKMERICTMTALQPMEFDSVILDIKVVDPRSLESRRRSYQRQTSTFQSPAYFMVLDAIRRAIMESNRNSPTEPNRHTKFD